MADDNPTLLLVSVEDRIDGEMTVETTDGDEITERCILLELNTLVGETGAPMPVTLAIPTSAGPGLLQALLTDDQWDAVTSV